MKFRLTLRSGNFVDIEGLDRKSVTELTDEMNPNAVWLTFGGNPKIAIKQSSIETIEVIKE